MTAALALLVGLILVAVIVLGGNGTHRYTLRVQNAGQLVKDNDVQIGGRRVGSVRKIALASDNVAELEIEVEEPYAPLHEGTTATVRATSLSGQANRYVALVPGADNAPELDDDAVIEAVKNTAIVDLDELFDTLDPKTRTSLQNVVKGFATQYDGAERQDNEAARYFNPALSTTSRLVNELTRDEGTLTAFLVNSSKAVSALAERRDDLAGLVGNANATARAIGDENVALARALGLLPATLRKANTSFVNLRATLDDLDALVAVSKPATKDLAPFLRVLRPLVADARPTIGDLRRLVTRPGRDNDLVDATRKLPRLAKVASPTLKRATEALKKSQPVIEFVRPYTPDIVGWLRDFGQGSSAYDANGHYARIQPIFNAYQYTDSPLGGVLTSIPPEQRLDGLETGFQKRCPGTATQTAVDGSTPFTDGGKLDCDPKLVLPGP